MASRFTEIKDSFRDFISRQSIFFVGTAAPGGRVNVSPKGMDTLCVAGPNRVLWLNVTGSGNESAAHVQELPRMTLMFCAFEGKPLILRLYGTAQVVHYGEENWQALYERFAPVPGARQIFDMQVDLVQSSCGMAVPFFDYVDERNELKDWARNKGEQGLYDYWLDRNGTTVDGKATGIRDKVAVAQDIPPALG